MDERSKRAKLNIVVSLLCHVVTLACGLIVPRLMIGAFGSEVYGATASVAQFLAYITLLEGGIGGVARAALYKPLAEKNTQDLSDIINEIRRFFRVIAYVFVVYVLIIACSYKFISGIVVLDWLATFLLVLVISISTFGQYFIGISYSVLLQAAQKTYITNIVAVMGTVINTAMVVILVNFDCNIIVVKLVSSIVFVMRPVALWLYVKKHYNLQKAKKHTKSPPRLNQKLTGLGQHMAYFLHSNTDVVVLTWLANLSSVAIYSVYHMVVAQIQNITTSFTAGMEALFGDMLAKKETELLYKTFGYYDTLISTVATFTFSCTAVLILPFVKIYTAGIQDANYYAPAFSILIVLASYLTCLRSPYHSMTIAAGHFKQTRLAAYGECLINIAVSIVLVWQYGLVGVAIGTLVAVAFRFLFYVIYLSKHIFNRKVSLFVKRLCINSIEFAVVFFLGKFIVARFEVSDYFAWMICGIVVAIVAIMIIMGVNFVFYREDFILLLNKILRKRRGSA